MKFTSEEKYGIISEAAPDFPIGATLAEQKIWVREFVIRTKPAFIQSCLYHCPVLTLDEIKSTFNRILDENLAQNNDRIELEAEYLIAAELYQQY